MSRPDTERVLRVEAFDDKQTLGARGGGWPSLNGRIISDITKSKQSHHHLPLSRHQRYDVGGQHWAGIRDSVRPTDRPDTRKRRTRNCRGAVGICTSFIAVELLGCAIIGIRVSRELKQFICPVKRPNRFQKINFFFNSGRLTEKRVCTRSNWTKLKKE